MAFPFVVDCKCSPILAEIAMREDVEEIGFAFFDEIFIGVVKRSDVIGHV